MPIKGTFYKPATRELMDFSVSSPISGYRRRYTEEAPDEISEVTSDIELQIPTSSFLSSPLGVEVRQPRIVATEFEDKEQFVDTMSTLYEKELRRRGKDPNYARWLVAQDGLESSWGKKPAAANNFGGIKGRGTVRDTTEYIGGVKRRVKDSFRDFDSLEDYVEYKVGLLDGSRYKAFDGDYNGFAERVARGGYATAPNYSEALRRMVSSFQLGGLIEIKPTDKNVDLGKAFVNNWYWRRYGKIKENAKEDTGIPWAGTRGLNMMRVHLLGAKPEVNPGKVPEGQDTMFSKWQSKLYFKDDDYNLAIKEFTKVSQPYYQTKKIERIQDKLGKDFYSNGEGNDSPLDVYTELMNLRGEIHANPSKTYSKEEVEKLKRTNNNKALKRYSTEALVELLNDVADTREVDVTILGRLGLKIPKGQNGEIMRRDTRQWMRDKNGEYAWARRNNREYPEFWDRLMDRDKEEIVDWEDPESIATHKMGYGEYNGKTIVYPEVQRVNGRLVDYTRPPYSSSAGIESAIESKNYAVAPNESVADNFTKTYKQQYPGFEDHDIFKDEVNRNTYHLRSYKADYVYQKLLDAGYNNTQASAILGSLFVEGQLDENTNEIGGKGYGLMQWTDSARKNKLKNFRSKTAKNEFERQVDFLISELGDDSVWLGKRWRDEFLNAKDVDSATEILARRFARPAAGREKMDSRKEVARYYANNELRYESTVAKMMHQFIN